jgi:hypothetical protein
MLLPNSLRRGRAMEPSGDNRLFKTTKKDS